MEASNGEYAVSDRAQQQALEHMRKAQELGMTLKVYASKFGLEVQQLYQLIVNCGEAFRVR